MIHSELFQVFHKEDLQRMVDQRTSQKPLIHLEIQDKLQTGHIRRGRDGIM